MARCRDVACCSLFQKVSTELLLPGRYGKSQHQTAPLHPENHLLISIEKFRGFQNKGQEPEDDGYHSAMDSKAS